MVGLLRHGCGVVTGGGAICELRALGRAPMRKYGAWGTLGKRRTSAAKAGAFCGACGTTEVVP